MPQFPPEQSKTGEFKRQEDAFRDWVKRDGSTACPPEANRLGNRLTEADWRLFPTLIRFDAVYHGHFKCNLRRIVDYPNLWPYLRDLYQHDDVAETVNFDHIKRHYYMTHEQINPTRIVPIGPLLDLRAPHGREKLSVALSVTPSRKRRAKDGATAWANGSRLRNRSSSESRRGPRRVQSRKRGRRRSVRHTDRELADA